MPTCPKDKEVLSRMILNYNNLQRMVTNGHKKEKKLKMLLLVSWAFFCDGFTNYENMESIHLQDKSGRW